MQSEAVAVVHGSLAELPPGRWLLAVSGGRDSMVLLQAMARVRRAEIAAVGTFDHGTGEAATRACRLVERVAMSLELPVVSGRADDSPAGKPAAEDEAGWRAARWRFLNEWAAELRAIVVTAHTRDDQIETVFLRLLREAGPRGLAGMRAIEPSGRVLRPLLTLPRTAVAAYASAERVEFVEDPSNRSLAFARNRARLELLPAFERVSPGFGEWCWSLGERAAEWRAEVAALVDRLKPTMTPDGRVVVDIGHLPSLTAETWAILWPEIAARAGVVMDRRGIARASAWAPRAAVGAEIQLAGGARIIRTARTFVVYSSNT